MGAPLVRDNSFDLIRLIAAVLVLWSHQHALLGIAEPNYSNGHLGVCLFFCISGFLNTQSLLKRPSVPEFLIRRAQRIFPALIGLSVFCIVLGLALTTDAAAYLKAAPTFFAKNSVTIFGIIHTLPGVFEQNATPAINGSLWTLPIEIKFYAILAVGAFVTMKFRSGLAYFAAAIFVICCLWFLTGPTGKMTNLTLIFGLLFSASSIIASVQERLGLSYAVLATIASMLVVCFVTNDMIATGALLAVLAGQTKCPLYLKPKIDISYGFYLYAFPVQQIVASFYPTFWVALVVSFVSTTALAVLSSVVIEMPAMRLGRNDHVPAITTQLVPSD